MRGVIAAGGSGTRLGPLTVGLNKHLLPIHDKPMIYYPLATLMAAGIREIILVTGPSHVEQFQRLLAGGQELGIQIQYAIQENAHGVADVLRSVRKLLCGEDFALILGDNFFHGPGLGRQLSTIRPTQGGHVFASRVRNPQDYGVVIIDGGGEILDVEEKPAHPRSDLAIPGLYFYSADVWEFVDALRPSVRGELEISDLNQALLRRESLKVEILPRGTVWLDAGTVDSLEEASEFVRVVQQRQGLLIGCPEEIAFVNSWLTPGDLLSRAAHYQASPYGTYLRKLATGKHS